jgi:hypothetical protein
MFFAVSFNYTQSFQLFRYRPVKLQVSQDRNILSLDANFHKHAGISVL